MKKISIFSIALLMMMFSLSVYAEEEITEISESTFVSPSYSDIYSTEDIEAMVSEEISGYIEADENYAGIQTFSSIDSAAAYMRSQLVARNTEIAYRISDQSVYSMDAAELIGRATEDYAGCATYEGDYLKANIIGFQFWGSSTSTYVECHYTMIYTSSASQEAQVTNVVNSLVSQLGLRSGSEIDKVKTIHDYLAKTVEYDYAGAGNPYNYLCHSTYSALIQKTSVCQGYASAFYRLAREAGLSCRFITGIGDNGSSAGRHAWNIVKIGNYWYNIDCTWDASNPPIYTYYLKNNAAFGDHYRDDQYSTADFNSKHPMAAYSYGEDNGGDTSSSSTNPVNSIYTALDGSAMSTVANGTPKILIYYGYGCGNSRSTIRSISNSEWIKNNNIEVLAMNTAGTLTAQEEYSTVKNFAATYDPQNKIKFSYMSREEASRDMWRYVHAEDLGTATANGGTSVTWPVIIVLDKNNQIRYSHSAYISAESLEQMGLKPYIEGWKSGDGSSSDNPGTSGDVVAVSSFVSRLYSIVLGRPADATGLNDWTNKLLNKEKTGSEVALGFFMSQEMINRNLPDDEYVKICYRTMLAREADAGGLADWVAKLENGISREAVLYGFTNSTEFDNICTQYGIVRGTLSSKQNRDQNPGITGFVARCYTKALGRKFDVDGLNDWSGQILTASNKKQKAEKVASDGFFHSQEFANKNTSNGEYVEILYRTFLGREYDQAGYNDWVGQLNSGKSRDEVLYGFSRSAEFNNIMASYGL